MPRKKMAGSKHKQFTATTKLDTDEKKRLVSICEYKDLSVSQVIRTALREYMARFSDARRPERGRA